MGPNGERYLGFISISLNFNLISKKKRICALWANDALVVSQKQLGLTSKNAPRHTTASRQTATRVDEREGLRCRVRAAASLYVFFGRAG